MFLLALNPFDSLYIAIGCQIYNANFDVNSLCVFVYDENTGLRQHHLVERESWKYVPLNP